MVRLMVRLGGALLLLLLVAALWAGWRLADRGGLFVQIEPVPIAGCTLVPAAPGAEDIEIDAVTGWVFISAHDRRAMLAGEWPRGAILAAHADRMGDGFTDLTAGLAGARGPDQFGPHGISVHSGPDGTRLAVVNHRTPDMTTVELYAIDYKDDAQGGVRPELRHLRTIASDLFTSPNDIVLVGPETYYATNDHHYSGGWRETAETYLLLDVATLVYGEGQTVRVAAEGLTYPNGVNVSPDGRVLYLTETTDGVLRVYDRDTATGDLTLRPGAAGRMPIGRGPDNIEVTADGAIWIGGHPVPLKLNANGADAANPSPSEIIRLPVDATGQPGGIERIYVDDGMQFSGATVAVPHAGGFIAGSVYDDRLLSCPLSSP
jgi:arylesterase/paraoxonase